MNDVIGKTITDIALGDSFIEITLEDGRVLVIESTDYKSSKHQDCVNVNVRFEHK